MIPPPVEYSPMAVIIIVAILTMVLWAIMLVLFGLSGRFKLRTMGHLLLDAFVMNMGCLVLSCGSFGISAGVAMCVLAMIDFVTRLVRHIRARDLDEHDDYGMSA